MPFLDSQIAHWTTDPDALPALREMSSATCWRRRSSAGPSATRSSTATRRPSSICAGASPSSAPGSRRSQPPSSRAAWSTASGSRSGRPTSRTRCCSSSPAAQVGAIYCPLNPLYREAEVALRARRWRGARCQFVEPVNRGTSLWDISLAATSGLAELELHVALGRRPTAAGSPGTRGLPPASVVSAQEIQARRRQVTRADIHQLQFTSGTTGFPKGCRAQARRVLQRGAADERPGGPRRGVRA